MSCVSLQLVCAGSRLPGRLVWSHAHIRSSAPAMNGGQERPSENTLGHFHTLLYRWILSYYMIKQNEIRTKTLQNLPRALAV